MQNSNSPATNRNLAGKIRDIEESIKLTQAGMRAWDRIGGGGDKWQEMAWFVQFSTLDFDNISDGDLLNVQEEVCAISLLYGSRPPSKKLITRQQMKLPQKEIASYLEDFVQKEAVLLGPFSYKLWVGRVPSGLDITKLKMPLTNDQFTDSMIITRHVMVDNDTEGGPLPFLRYHFAKLLPEFANSLLPCPKCQKIFLKFRRHATFCSRACQSRAAMETNRAKKKKEKLAAQKGSKPKTMKSTAKNKGGK